MRFSMRFNRTGLRSIGLKKVVATVIAIACMCTTAACGSSQTSPNDAGSNDAAASSAAFSGPWGAQYQRAYEGAQTERGKRILEDEQVTDAEISEIRSAYASCLAQSGITATFDSSGGGSIQYPQGQDALAEQAQSACDKQTDYKSIEFLYEVTKSNPNNTDQVPQLVQCLVRHGLVDASMTAEEYKQIVSDPAKSEETFGKYLDSSRADYDAAGATAFTQCQSDPSA